MRVRYAAYAAVTIYMLPNMFVVMGLTVLVVFLGLKMDNGLLALIMTIIAAVLAVLSYRRVCALARIADGNCGMPPVRASVKKTARKAKPSGGKATRKNGRKS